MNCGQPLQWVTVNGVRMRDLDGPMCGQPAVVVYQGGCRGEHIETVPACQEHADAFERRYAERPKDSWRCRQCAEAGRKETVLIRKVPMPVS